MSKNNSGKKINLSKDFSYPDPNDPDFLTKIFKKREFFYHKVPERKKLETYEEVQKYREQNCKEGEIIPREQQAIVPNFISPNTPYKGVILMHGTGSGKTGSAILIAEQFKEQVKKYNTKIFVIVPGPNTRDNFKNEKKGVWLFYPLADCPPDGWSSMDEPPYGLSGPRIAHRNESSPACKRHPSVRPLVVKPLVHLGQH